MKFQKAIGAGVMSLGLVVGLSGFAGAEAGTSGSIHTTGYKSYNVVAHHTSNKVNVDNDNDLHVYSRNDQGAWTGDAGVYHNTTAGDISTGSATNTNNTNVSATIDNSASTAAVMPAADTSSADSTGTINTTGAYSYNKVVSTDTNKVNISNDNDLSVMNSNEQHAASGDVTAAGNTTVGNVTTGDASNTNSTTISFNVTN